MSNVAFLIGCEKYNQENIPNLVGVNNDVFLMRDVLVENCGCSSEKVFVITDKEENNCRPTGENILNLLLEKARIFSEEQINNLFFYFSGHGYLSTNNEVCFICKDSTVFPIQHGILTQDKIVTVLKEFRYVKHIILFLDICQDELVTKSIITTQTIDLNYFPKGTVVFYSCFPGKSSYMIPASSVEKYGVGSVFTKCLTDALCSKNGCYTVNEISDYLKINVPILGKELGINQKPYTQLQDISLGKLCIVNGMNKEYTNLSESEIKMIDDFAKEIDINNRILCIQYGSATENKTIGFSETINEIFQSKNRDKAEIKKFDFLELEQTLNGFLILIYQFKRKIKINNLLRFILGEMFITEFFLRLENDRNEFFNQMEGYKVCMLMDIAYIERIKENLLIHIKELYMYVCAAKIAIKNNDDIGKEVLVNRVSSLQENIRICENYISMLDEYIGILTDLEIEVNNGLHMLQILFNKLSLSLTIGFEKKDNFLVLDDIIKLLEGLVDGINNKHIFDNMMR